MTLLTVSIVRKYVILIDKSINLKLISKKNYDTKLKKKKKKKIIHILDTSTNTTLLNSKVGNKKFINYLKSFVGCSMHLHIQLKP